MRVIRKSCIRDENRDGYTIMRMGTFKIKSNLENVGLYLTKIPIDGKVSHHYHPKGLEILIFLKEGMLKSGEKKWMMEEGDMVILKPGELHEISGRPETELIAIRMPNYKDDKIVI